MVVALSCCSASSLSALDPKLAITQYSLSVWTSEEGLPQDTVRDFAQTPDGLLWLGTQAGLVRFDGVQFQVFDRRSDLEIDNHHIYALAVDTAGDLWVGTNGGGLLRRRGGRFEPVAVEAIPTGRITSLEAGPAGTLWVGTYGDGLLHYDPRRAEDQRWRDFGGEQGLSHGVIFDLALDASGDLWIATYGGGINRLRKGGQSDTFEVFDTAVGLADNGTWAVQPSADGSVWFGTNKGLNHWVDGRLEVLDRSNGLPHDRVISLLEDLDGNLWIGTYGGGLCRRRSDGRLDQLRALQGLAGDVVWSLFEDRDGLLWAGSLGSGFTQLRRGAFTTYGAEEGLSSDITSSLFTSRDGDLWIATRGSGVNILRPSATGQNDFEILDRRHGLASDGVWEMTQDRDGDLWFATNGAGVQRRRGDGSWQTFTTADGLADNVVFGLLLDSRDDLWFGTNGGLSRFRDGTFESYTTNEGLSSDQVRALMEDRDGSLWIGTTGGLCHLKNEKFDCYSTADGLSSNNVWSIYQDAEGMYWLGTAGGGLVRFDGETFVPLTSREGLYDDEVTEVLEDDLGYFWLSSSRGVFRIQRQEIEDFVAQRSDRLSYTTYGAREGIRNAAGHATGMKTEDGRIWFAHLGGYSVVDPSEFYVLDAPRVLLETFRVGGEVVSDPGELPPSSRDFEFHFTAPTLTLPERIRFRYRLLGFEEEWKNVGGREVRYSFLKPGRYTFEVSASDSDGQWTGPVTALEFQVEPAFYLKSSFFLALAMALLLMFYLLHTLRVRGLQKRERELNLRVDESMASLKILKGLLPVCATCHKVRESDGQWQPIERYIQENTEASMSHSVCPDCALTLYPDIFDHPDASQV